MGLSNYTHKVIITVFVMLIFVFGGTIFYKEMEVSPLIAAKTVIFFARLRRANYQLIIKFGLYFKLDYTELDFWRVKRGGVFFKGGGIL